MATIRKRPNKDGSITYTADIRIKGFPFITQAFKSEQEAKEWADLTERSLRSDHQLENKLMFQMFDRYESDILPNRSSEQKKSEKLHIAFWKEHLGKNLIKDITPLMIENIANTLYEKISRSTGLPLSAESRRKYLMTLSYIYRIAGIEWKWVIANPVALVDKHIKQCKELKDKKREKLEKNPSPAKKIFVAQVKKEMSDRGITSIEGLANFCALAKTTVQKQMDASCESTIRSLEAIARGLGKTLKIVLE